MLEEAVEEMERLEEEEVAGEEEGEAVWEGLEVARRAVGDTDLDRGGLREAEDEEEAVLDSRGEVEGAPGVSVGATGVALGDLLGEGVKGGVRVALCRPVGESCAVREGSSVEDREALLVPVPPPPPPAVAVGRVGVAVDRKGSLGVGVSVEGAVGRGVRVGEKEGSGVGVAPPPPPLPPPQGEGVWERLRV